MKKIITAILLILILGIVSCARETDTENSYRQVSASEAKEIMDNSTGYIILDVRTQSEYEEGHIPGAVLMPYDEIPDKAESILKDRNQVILVYCRSGNRSKKGAQNLVNLGYTNVVEFGGINSWPYEVVK